MKTFRAFLLDAYGRLHIAEGLKRWRSRRIRRGNQEEPTQRRDDRQGEEEEGPDLLSRPSSEELR